MFLSSILKGLQRFHSPKIYFSTSVPLLWGGFPNFKPKYFSTAMHVHYFISILPQRKKSINFAFVLLLSSFCKCFLENRAQRALSSNTVHSPPATQHVRWHTAILLPHASPQPMNLKHQKDVKMQASSRSQEMQNKNSHDRPAVLLMRLLFFAVFYAIITQHSIYILPIKKLWKALSFWSSRWKSSSAVDTITSQFQQHFHTEQKPALELLTQSSKCHQKHWCPPDFTVLVEAAAK